LADSIYDGDQTVKKQEPYFAAKVFELQCLFNTSAAFREEVFRFIGRQFPKLCAQSTSDDPWYIGANMAGTQYMMEVKLHEGVATVFPYSYDECKTLSEEELRALIRKRDGTGKYGILFDEARDGRKGEL
jgi:hypothetical protein